jgi:hypothetical protein
MERVAAQKVQGGGALTQPNIRPIDCARRSLSRPDGRQARRVEVADSTQSGSCDDNAGWSDRLAAKRPSGKRYNAA